MIKVSNCIIIDFVISITKSSEKGAVTPTVPFLFVINNNSIIYLWHLYIVKVPLKVYNIVTR